MGKDRLVVFSHIQQEGLTELLLTCFSTVEAVARLCFSQLHMTNCSLPSKTFAHWSLIISWVPIHYLDFRSTQSDSLQQQFSRLMVIMCRKAQRAQTPAKLLNSHIVTYISVYVYLELWSLAYDPWKITGQSTPIIWNIKCMNCSYNMSDYQHY